MMIARQQRVRLQCWFQRAIAGVLAFALMPFSLAAPPRPSQGDVSEGVNVRLVLVDVVVTDRKGRTVPDLKLEDFIVSSDARYIDPDTIDVNCSGGALEDVRGVRPGKTRPKLDIDTLDPRRVVLAFDYQHLPVPLRGKVLSQARSWVKGSLSPR